MADVLPKIIVSTLIEVNKAHVAVEYYYQIYDKQILGKYSELVVLLAI